MASSTKKTYRFTFGPWNISTGEDPFGPAARKEVAFASKIREYKKLGFDGVQAKTVALGAGSASA